MPPIKPFRGLIYDRHRAPIAKVATEPYDKITPAMQEAYLGKHPYNFVRLILDKILSTDDAVNNRYVRSAARLREWIQQGILRPEAAPAFYLYEQTFRLPGLGQKTRRGIIGLVRLEDFSKGNILPHERTLAKPRKDRMRLLEATRANLEQIFLLYDDARGRLEQKMAVWAKTKPLLQFSDPKGVRQRVWRISRTQDTDLISQWLGHRKLFIADGHHRYTISNLYHKKILARKGSENLKAASAWRMATFVNMRNPGLVILPTHRLVEMPAGWDAKKILKDLAEDFDVQVIPGKGSLVSAAKDMTARIRRMAGQGPVYGLLTKSCRAILKLRKTSAVQKRVAALLGKNFSNLDVAVLHRLIIQKQLRISPKSVERGGQIAYIREPQDVARRVESGASAIGFLQNPAAIDQVKCIALAGQCMPQKSTDFYPKLLSGLVVYDMMERCER